MDNSEFKEGFITEAHEYLDIMNTTMLALEKRPADAKLLNELFRAVHTLKSIAALMSYDQIMDLAQQMESVLDRYRSTKTPIPGNIIDLLFECQDLFTALVEEVVSGTSENLDVLPMIQRLSLLLN
jgi:two-component system chemotaxis sensor kinase CheA